MSSPTRRSSVAHIPAIGPSSSLLERLLQEINEHDAPRSDPVFASHDGPGSRKDSVTSPRKVSLNCNIPPLARQNSSVWAKGGTAAEDARQKLRALDEARQRKSSLVPSPDATVARKSSPAKPSPPLFSEFSFNRAATFSTADLHSPSPDEHFGAKRDRSGAYSPDLISKRLRQDSFPDMACRDREYSAPSTPSTPPSRVVTTHIQSATPSDPVLHLESLKEVPTAPPSPLHGFHSTPKHAYTPFRPATPCRSPSPEYTQATSTPAWMRPLHLVEDDVSIYKNVHFDKDLEHPLCLYCFRQHGEFRRLVDYKCEICGQGKLLEGHYWD